MSHAKLEFDFDLLFNDLEKGWDDFARNFPLEQFARGNYKQYPVITLLSCSDSRVPGNMVGNMFNRVFSVENIGNQVRTAEGSILYGLLHLRTPIMIVSGHSDCGAIKAADYDDEPPALRRELEIVHQSISEGMKSFAGVLSADETKRYTQMAEINVDVQINYLLENPKIKGLVDKKELYLLGTILDLHNVYEGGYGKTYISNVNGEKNPAAVGIDFLSVRAARIT